MRIRSLLSPEEIASLGGLPGLAIAGGYEGEDMAVEDFRPNGAFVDFLHRVIREAGPSDPGMIAGARRQEEGWLYVIDRRAPEGSQGRVAVRDIIGGFEVRAGEIVPGSYTPNESHEVLTSDGLITLPDSLRSAFVDAVRQLGDQTI